MKYRLIVSDFDDTMAKHGVISEENVKAIKEYSRRGGKFVVCSGRTPSSIMKRTANLGLKTLACSHQGAIIFDMTTGEVVRDGGLDGQTAIKIVKEIKKDGELFVLYLGDKLFYERPCDYQQTLSALCETIQVSDVVETIKAHNQKVCRIVINADPKRVPELEKLYREKFKDIAIVNSGTKNIVEIISPNFSKKQAVEFLAKYYDLPFSEVMAIGDSSNDIPLISGEWHGVAVGTAFPELKAVADEVTVPFDQHPIKYLIEKYCLKDEK